MGWLYGPKPACSLAEWFRDQYALDNDQRSQRVLDVAVVALSEAYIAIEVIEKATGARRVVAGVWLIRFTRDGDFGRKDMDESMGPCQHRAPSRILDLLTPLDDESDPRGYARAWRAGCRERLARIKQAHRLKPGAVVRFQDEIGFTDGHRGTLYRWIGHDTFAALAPDGTPFPGRYRIRGWRSFPTAPADTPAPPPAAAAPEVVQLSFL